MPGETIVVNTATEETPIVEIATETVEEFEVTREWVESLFASVSAGLLAMGETLRSMGEQQGRIREFLQSLDSRLPGNLTQMISEQQGTITSLIAQGQETTREILRTTLTPPPQPAVQPTEPQNAEVAPVAPETAPPAELPRPKRRRI